MSVLVDENSRIIVQGFGRAGQFHAQQCIDYGSKIVGGVHPGRGGQEQLGVPVFNTVRDAADAVKPDASIVFVPPPGAADAILEAVESEIEFVVCITEGIPVRDMVMVADAIRGSKTRLLGPNCPGVISPGKCKLGIMPAKIHKARQHRRCLALGHVDLRSGRPIDHHGVSGQSTCIGIGGDPIIGTNFIDALALFNDDPATTGIIMIGEIGGTAEEAAAEFVKSNVKKPVAGFIAGATAPPGRRMGHAGAIISGGKGTAKEKQAAMEAAGIAVAPSPAELASTLAQLM